MFCRGVVVPNDFLSPALPHVLTAMMHPVSFLISVFVREILRAGPPGRSFRNPPVLATGLDTGGGRRFAGVASQYDEDLSDSTRTRWTDRRSNRSSSEGRSPGGGVAHPVHSVGPTGQSFLFLDLLKENGWSVGPKVRMFGPPSPGLRPSLEELTGFQPARAEGKEIAIAIEAGGITRKARGHAGRKAADQRRGTRTPPSSTGSSSLARLLGSDGRLVGGVGV
jgi:hypothetical protein